MRRSVPVYREIFVYKPLKQGISSNLSDVTNRALTAILLITDVFQETATPPPPQLNQEEIFLKTQASLANRVSWWSHRNLIIGYHNWIVCKHVVLWSSDYLLQYCERLYALIDMRSARVTTYIVHSSLRIYYLGIYLYI